MIERPDHQNVPTNRITSDNCKSCLRVRLYINKNIIMIMYYSVESILRSFIDIDDRNKRIILSIYDVNVSCIVTPLSLAVTHRHNSPC